MRLLFRLAVARSLVAVVWNCWDCRAKGKKNPKRDASYRMERIDRSYLKRAVPDR